MIIKEVSSAAKICLNNRHAGIIGLSIRNAYFRDQKNLEALLQYGVQTFSKIYIMLPDVPAISTLMSFGYSEKEARQKSNLACNNLQNKCVRYLDSITSKDKYEIIRWGRIQENVDYINSLNSLNSLYLKDENFRQAIRNTTMQVILNNGTELSLENALEYGVHFIIQELAFISNSAKILNESSTAYVYHLEMLVLRNLLNQEYDLNLDGKAGYIVAETENSVQQMSAG